MPRSHSMDSPISLFSPNCSDFPPLQSVRAPNRLQQKDLASITTPPSPCSPHVFTSVDSSQGNMASTNESGLLKLMDLSPHLMEKLEADLALLQEKYGLVSQVLTPTPATAPLPHQIANSVQADLFRSKQAAMCTFASPLRLNSVSSPMAPRTEGPFAIQAPATSSPCHSPPSLNNPTGQSSEGSLPVRGIIPQYNPAVMARMSTGNGRGKAPLQSSNILSSICTVPVSGNAPPIAPSTVRGNAPCTAPSTVEALAEPSPVQASESVRGNAPLHTSVTQGSVPARGTSWAARLGGSRSTSSTPLSYFPPTLVAGIPSVFITSDEFKFEIDECENWVVGYFIGKRLPLHIVKNQVERHWNLKGTYKIECRGDKCFYFRFTNDDDRLMVLERGMLHIASRLFILRKWSAKVEEDAISLDTVPIWATLKGIPRHACNAKGFSKLGSVIGKPIIPDRATDECTRTSIARLCIEITPECKFPSTIPIYQDSQFICNIKVAYPWRPPCCKDCNTFSHGTKDCLKRKQATQVWSAKNPPQAHSNSDHLLSNSEEGWTLVGTPSLPLGPSQASSPVPPLTSIPQAQSVSMASSFPPSPNLVLATSPNMVLPPSPNLDLGPSPHMVIVPYVPPKFVDTDPISVVAPIHTKTQAKVSAGPPSSPSMLPSPPPLASSFLQVTNFSRPFSANSRTGLPKSLNTNKGGQFSPLLSSNPFNSLVND